MPSGVYDHSKIRKSRETRICAHPKCNITFEVIVTSKRKYCLHKCYLKTMEGRHLSEETKEKIGVSNGGENNPKYGKTYEEYYGEEKAKEVKKKIGETSGGKKVKS